MHNIFYCNTTIKQNLRERKLSSSSSSDGKTIKTTFGGNFGIEGTAIFTQESGDQNQLSGKWTVKLSKFDKSVLAAAGEKYECDSGLNWHVHEKKVPELEPGNCGATGGHADPTFGCTGASEFRKKECDGTPIAADEGSDPKTYTGNCCEVIYGLNPYACDDGENLIKCEAGDQSGKLGKIKFNMETQVFEDSFSLPIEDLEELSLVIHCGGPRVACGNF